MLVCQLSGSWHKALGIFKEAYPTEPVKPKRFTIWRSTLKLAWSNVFVMHINILSLPNLQMGNCAQAKCKQTTVAKVP